MKSKPLNEILLANLKAKPMEITGNFIMRRAYLEGEIKKLEKEMEEKK